MQDVKERSTYPIEYTNACDDMCQLSDLCLLINSSLLHKFEERHGWKDALKARGGLSKDLVTGGIAKSRPEDNGGHQFGIQSV